jgi:hypothetical protein
MTVQEPEHLPVEEFPEEEFKIRETRMAEGGTVYRFDITGRTRDHLENLAAWHGMTLEEWLDLTIRPWPPLRLKIKAAVFPVFHRACAWLDRLIG